MDFTDLNLQDCVATQLRCGNIFSKNHFITYFPRNMLVKNLKIGLYLAKILLKVCGLLLGHPIYPVTKLDHKL